MDIYQGLLIGLLIGITNGHALRIVILDDDSPFIRYFVAFAAMIIYGLASVLVSLMIVWGFIIAILGPIIGLTAIFLSERARVDIFQAILAIPQVFGMILSAWMVYVIYL